jgi:universal stress protein E
MNTITNILVFVDPTATEHPAVEKAALIASQCGARIELYACETKESRAMRYSAHLAKGGPIEFVTHLRAVLEEVAKPLAGRGLDVCVEVTSGDPLHVQLLDRAQHTKADLVIKDTHHHSLAKRTFITNTDWHLIRGCPVPLLLTKAKRWTEPTVIVAAVDPSHVNDKPAALDHEVLQGAHVLAGATHGSVHALHAYLPIALSAEVATGMPVIMSAMTPKMMDEERVAALEQVQTLCKPFGIDSQHAAVKLGVASDVIPNFAEEVDADVVVMGAISRSGLARLFIGSTAERVLETLPCDVLVIKPPDLPASLS